MSNLFKKALVVLVMSLVTVITVHALKVSSIAEGSFSSDNYDFIEAAKLASSRYTHPDDLSIVDPAYYVEIDSRDDTLVSSNDKFELYINYDYLSFKILNKDTGYVWSTAIENPDAGSYSGILSSGIGIEYIMIE